MNDFVVPCVAIGLLLSPNVVTEMHALDSNRTDQLFHTTRTQYIEHRQEASHSSAPMECKRMNSINADWTHGLDSRMHHTSKNVIEWAWSEVKVRLLAQPIDILHGTGLETTGN